MEIISVRDEAFKSYGRIVDEYDFSQLLEQLDKTSIAEGVAYVPSVPELEQCSVKAELEEKFFGGLDIQIGYCNGYNKKLNALEYHRSSEINVALYDTVLMLGHQWDIECDYTYDTSKVQAFLVPAGTAIELFAPTLHYAPCNVSDCGFKVAVVLPLHTNEPLNRMHSASGEDRLLAAVNKWLIGHVDGGFVDDEFIGLKGANLSL